MEMWFESPSLIFESLIWLLSKLRKTTGEYPQSVKEPPSCALVHAIRPETHVPEANFPSMAELLAQLDREIEEDGGNAEQKQE